MRVLQVARYGSVKGGAETYIAAVSEGLRSAGHEVALAYGIDPDPSRPEVRDGFEISGIEQPRATPQGEDRGLRDAIGSFRPEVVHVHLPDVPWIAPLAASMAPTVLAVHDHRLHCPVGTKYWAAWGRACTVRPGPWCLAFNVVAHCGSLRANATLAPYRGWTAARAGARGLRLQVFSAHVRDELSRAGTDPSSITVTPYPVPPLAEPAGGEDGPDDLPVVLAGGRMSKEKGFDQLLAALAFCEVPVHLVLAGDGHERARLVDLARARVPGIHRVTVTGWLDAGALARWTERAAVVALPSMWPEPFGIAGLEAMARGRPVVAFATGGIPEWLSDDAGELLRPGDVAGLGRAIEGLVRDPDRRERMGAAGRARAREHYSIEGHVESLVALYRGLGS